MTSRSNGRRWLPVIVLGGICTAGLGVALGHRLDPTQAAGATPFCDPSSPTAMVGAPVPPFTAVDQRGNAVTDRDFHGKPWIADFIFTSCTASCPILTGRLIALQHQLAGVPVGFVSFSVDPEHDTPPVMKAYAERWQGDPARWRLLSTDRNTLGLLGGALGGAEDPSTAGPFHSDRFALIDGGGRVLGLYSSASQVELDRLRRDLADALAVTPEAPAGGAVHAPAAGAALP